jgi:tetratricopeptide (TPR) repeat protein
LALLKSPKLISQAMRYSGHASWLEQRYIRATDAEIGVRYEEMREQLREIMSRFPDEKEAYFKLGQYYWRQRQLDSALAYLNRTVEIDPTHREAYNYLMYAYNEAGRFDLAVLAIDKYISLAPGEANPYDSRGDLLAQNGKPLDAADSYLKALRIKPDFTASAVKLALLWIYAHDLQHADSLMQALAQSPNEATRNSAKYLTALIPVYQGKFNGALEVIDSLAKDGEQAQLYELKARIYAERGQFAQARAALDRAIATLHESSPQDSVTFGYLQAHYLAALGDLAGAESIRRRLAAHTQATGESPCYEYWAAGGIELALGNPVEAAKQLERGTAITTIATDFTGNFLLARAYFEAGRPGESVTLFEKLTEVYSSGRLLSPIENVKLHYFLGQAYEESRWYDQAAQQYRMFLSFWSEPDSDLTSVDDARARLKRLENRL